MPYKTSSITDALLIEDFSPKNKIDNPLKRIDEIFTSKRLPRYIEKIKQLFIDRSYYKVLKAAVKTAYLSAYQDKESLIGASFGFNPLFLGIKENSEEEKIAQQKYFDKLYEIFSTEKYDDLLEYIYDTAFDSFCENYLCGRASNDREINGANFVSRAMPSEYNLMPYLNTFISSFFRYLFLAIIPELYGTSDAQRSASEVLTEISNLEKTIKEKDNEKQALLKTIESLKQQNEALKEEVKLSKEEAVQNSMLDDITAAYDDLKRKQIKLEKKFNSLNDKYQSLKETIGEDIDDEFENIVIPQEIDPNQRFIIFGKFYDIFKNKLEEAFPNSKIYANLNDEVNTKNCDLVICAASFISHDFYYKIKNKCISGNIPFLSTNHRNVDLIKADIAAYYYSKGTENKEKEGSI